MKHFSMSLSKLLLFLFFCIFGAHANEHAAKCAKGDLEECNNVGKMLHKAGSKQEAKSYFQKACDNNFAPSCNNLGVVLRSEKDEGAKAAFKKACDGNTGDGCLNYGFELEQQGEIDAAIPLYDKGCDLGSAISCSNRALYHKTNNEIKKAKELYRKACDGEFFYACGQLGFIFEEHGDRVKAKSLYELGCKNKDPLSCRLLAVLDFQDEDFTAAKEHAEFACNNDIAYACFTLGLIHAAERNVEEARALFDKACASTVLDACFERGNFEYSLGNMEEAKIHWLAACASGDERSCSSEEQLSKTMITPQDLSPSAQGHVAGYKALKFGMSFEQVVKSEACDLKVFEKKASQSSYSAICYEVLGKKRLFSLEFNKQGGLTQISIRLGSYEEDVFSAAHEGLSTKYSTTYVYSEGETNAFNTGQKDKVCNLYEGGGVALCVVRDHKAAMAAQMFGGNMEPPIVIDIIYSDATLAPNIQKRFGPKIVNPDEF